MKQATAVGISNKARTALAAVLSVCLAAPMSLAMAQTAGADDDDATSAYRHGTVSITSDYADDDGVIEITAGETATIIVSPYAHMQYQCCEADYCPDDCEASGMAGSCFIVGMGCVCAGLNPTERIADVTSIADDESIVSVSDVVADETWENEDNIALTDATRPVTKDGMITLTGLTEGTTSVTVSAATDEDGSIYRATDGESTLLMYWYPASVTFTVTVTAAEDDEDVELAEGVTQTSHSVYGYREASYGDPPDGEASTDGMHVQAIISFDGTLEVTNEDALRESLLFTLNGGELNEAGEYTISTDGGDLVLDFVVDYAIYAGKIGISAVSADGLLDGIAVDGEDVVLESITTLVDTGLEFEATSVTAGTATTCASTTFEVTHVANIRSMNHIIWLTTAGSTDGTGSSILANSGGYSQSTVAHHHNWYNFTPAKSCEYIVSGGEDALAAVGYTLTDNEDGTFTITADEATEGEVLYAMNYTDSFFNATGLAYAEDVTGVAMPSVDGSDEDGSDEDGTDEDGTDATDDEDEDSIPIVTSFIDVQDDSTWYYEAIYAIAAAGIITGYTDGNGDPTGYFGVGDTMMRRDLAVIMWRALCPDEYAAYLADYYDSEKNTYDYASQTDESTCSGIADDTYWTAAADWCVANAIIEGKQKADGSRYFDATGKLTFAEIVQVIANYLAPDERDAISEFAAANLLADYADGSSVPSWAQKSMTWAIGEGIVQGTDEGYLKATNKVSRERAATLLYRAFIA